MWATAAETAPRERGRGRVLGSYLHGPLLARNTALADLLLAWAVASSTDSAEPVHLGPLDDAEELGPAGRAASRRWSGWAGPNPGTGPAGGGWPHSSR